VAGKIIRILLTPRFLGSPLSCCATRHVIAGLLPFFDPVIGRKIPSTVDTPLDHSILLSFNVQKDDTAAPKYQKDKTLKEDQKN